MSSVAPAGNLPALRTYAARSIACGLARLPGCVGGIVFSILWDDASLDELVRGPGFLEALGPGGIHVSMSTVTPDAARKAAASTVANTAGPEGLAALRRVSAGDADAEVRRIATLALAS